MFGGSALTVCSHAYGKGARRHGDAAFNDEVALGSKKKQMFHPIPAHQNKPSSCVKRRHLNQR
jgi:hypothetical protein